MKTLPYILICLMFLVACTKEELPQPREEKREKKEKRDPKPDPVDTTASPPSPVDTSGGPLPNPKPNPEPVPPPAQPFNLVFEFIRTAAQLPLDIQQTIELELDQVGNYLYKTAFAANSEQLVTTGTLTIDANGIATYLPSPADRLEVMLANGSRRIFRFRQVEGNFSNATHFGRFNHQLEFDLVVPDTADLSIRSVLDNGRRTISLAGQASARGRTYDLDLTKSGTVYFDIDFSGHEYRVDEQLSGTIIDLEGNFSQTVDETWFYESVFVNYTNNPTFRMAEHAIRTFNSVFTVAGQEYRFHQGKLRWVFRNGVPWDYQLIGDPQTPWLAEGQLLRDGQPIGRIIMREEEVFIKAYVEVGNELLEIGSWKKYS